MGLLEEYKHEPAVEAMLRAANSESGGARDALSEVEEQHARMRYALDHVLDIVGVTHGEVAFAAARVDVAAMLRDVAQHSRVLPARGVSIVVSQAADVRSITTDGKRAQDVVEASVACACRAARTGSIELSASMLSAPPLPPRLLLVVSHEGTGAEETELKEVAGDAVGVVGTAAVPEAYRAALLRQLGAGSVPEGHIASSYQLHGRLGRGRLSSSCVGGHLGQRMVPITAAQLGGHVGVFSDERGTRHWLLLPLAPPAHRWAPTRGVSEERALAVLTENASMRSMRTAAAPAAFPAGRSGRRILPGAASGGTPNAVHTSQTLQIDSPRSRPLPAVVQESSAMKHVKNLPTVRTAAATSDGTEVDAGDGGHAPVRPRRAMLVDDESTLRRLGARMLARVGVPTDTFEDGAEVAAALTPAHELLLLDIVMRHSDGAEVRVACIGRTRIM